MDGMLLNKCSGSGGGGTVRQEMEDKSLFKNVECEVPAWQPCENVKVPETALI